MTPRIAISWLHAAYRHFSESERYRWWALYAACLAGFMYSTWYWPWDMSVVIAYRLYPWLTDFGAFFWNWGLLLCGVLGVVGLLRRSWIARGLALGALWLTEYLAFPFWSPAKWLWTEFTWYTFDLPGKLIHHLTAEGSAAATCLWCVYLVLCFMLIRPLLKWAYQRYVLRLATWATERWPALQRLERPVM